MKSPFADAVAVGRSLVEGLVQLVYPSTCWVCDAPMPAQPLLVCDLCTAKLTRDPHPTCPRCSSTVGPHVVLDNGCPACRGDSFAFDGALRMGPYQDTLRDIILRTKHPAGEDLAEVIGTLWANQIAERVAALKVDVIIPVPLHWSRRWRRGFNQSEILARCLGQRLGVATQPRWLRRVRRTPYQPAQPSPTARRQNVRDAFCSRDGLDLTGRTVLLVDDVLTTGATAHEAARSLRRHRPALIFVAVLAHGT